MARPKRDMVRVNVYLGRPLYEKITQFARKNDSTTAECIRRFLNAGVLAEVEEKRLAKEARERQAGSRPQTGANA